MEIAFLCVFSTSERSFDAVLSLIHISDNTTENPASPLQWTGNAIDLVELIYGINEMGCINNGNMPVSYTHLDVYKRQVLDIGAGKGFLTVHLLKIANNVVCLLYT